MATSNNVLYLFEFALRSVHCLQPVSGTMIYKSPLRGAETKQTFVIFDHTMFEMEVRRTQ